LQIDFNGEGETVSGRVKFSERCGRKEKVEEKLDRGSVRSGKREGEQGCDRGPKRGPL